MSWNGFSQTDTTIHLPIKIGRLIESDLRLLDSAIVLIDIQDKLTAMQSRQIMAKDSVIQLKDIEKRAITEICLISQDSVKGLFVAEKKRRRSNGIWRDLFILTTAFALWLAIKP